MNENVKASLEILAKGYSMTFIVTLGFYFLIKILMKFKVKEEE